MAGSEAPPAPVEGAGGVASSGAGSPEPGRAAQFSENENWKSEGWPGIVLTST